MVLYLVFANTLFFLDTQTGVMFSAFIAKKLIEAFEGLAGFALLST